MRHPVVLAFSSTTAFLTIDTQLRRYGRYDDNAYHSEKEISYRLESNKCEDNAPSILLVCQGAGQSPFSVKPCLLEVLFSSINLVH